MLVTVIIRHGCELTLIYVDLLALGAFNHSDLQRLSIGEFVAELSPALRSFFNPLIVPLSIDRLWEGLRFLIQPSGSLEAV